MELNLIYVNASPSLQQPYVVIDVIVSQRVSVSRPALDIFNTVSDSDIVLVTRPTRSVMNQEISLFSCT